MSNEPIKVKIEGNSSYQTQIYLDDKKLDNVSRYVLQQNVQDQVPQLHLELVSLTLDTEMIINSSNINVITKDGTKINRESTENVIRLFIENFNEQACVFGLEEYTSYERLPEPMQKALFITFSNILTNFSVFRRVENV